MHYQLHTKILFNSFEFCFNWLAFSESSGPYDNNKSDFHVFQIKY